jgi:hypothetical protein
MSQSIVKGPRALLIKEQTAMLKIGVTIMKLAGSDRFSKMGAELMPTEINYFCG